MVDKKKILLDAVEEQLQLAETDEIFCIILKLLKAEGATERVAELFKKAYGELT